MLATVQVTHPIEYSSGTGSLEDDGAEGCVVALRTEGLGEAAPRDKAALFKRRCTNPNERFERVNSTRKGRARAEQGRNLDPEPYPFKLLSGLNKYLGAVETSAPY